MQINLAQLDPIFLTAGVGSGLSFASDVLVITSRKISTTGTDRDVEVTLGWIETI